ncbi:MAG: hypothetical protein LAT55_10480 [Opitutales bacterium]|nr:hypothetical protein [Opitutales bacterium]
MKQISLSKWYIGYGLFLAACGIAGYASNPEGAKTALMTGPGFGAIMVVLGILFNSLPKAVWWAALGFTLLLTAAFSWRATVGWQEVAAGEPKVFTASLISAMLVVSVASLAMLWKGRGKDSSEALEPRSAEG